MVSRAPLLRYVASLRNEADVLRYTAQTFLVPITDPRFGSQLLYYLTSIALDAGFASHSHFTARFRNFFGCTPAALRRMATAEQVGEMRKIMTARRN